MSSFFQTTFATPTTGANFIYLNASGQLYRYIQSSNSNTIIESNVDDIVSSTSDKKNVIFVSTDTVNANFKYLKEYNSTTQAVTELRHYNITSEYNKMYQVGAEPYYLSCTIG